MKRGLVHVMSLTAILGFACLGSATLINRGNGLIYDSDFNITWYANANNDFMSWDQAMTWAQNLSTPNPSGGGFITGWRLPSALNPDRSGPDLFFDVTGSEMGHLYYTELGNTAGYGGLINTGPFGNLLPYLYWSNTLDLSFGAPVAWTFFFDEGFQDAHPLDGDFGIIPHGFHALAVHDGDVGASSVPSITITTNPPLLSFAIDGQPYTSSQSFFWPTGSSHTIATTSPQGSGRTRYIFTGWSDGGAISHTIAAPSSSTAYIANFTTQYQLTTAASPTSGGIIIANPASADGFYDRGASVQLTATANANYSYLGWSGDLIGTINPQIVVMSAPKTVIGTFLPAGSSFLTLNAGGAATVESLGSDTDVQVGYAVMAVNSGATPYGTAVFSFKQSGVTVTEAGVPASPPTTLARVFIDYRPDVLALPGQSNSGLIDINTGIAVVNTRAATASVTYTLRDTAGTTLAIGNGTIAAGAHFAKFISQLTDVAPNFNLPSNFQTTTQFGTLEIASDQPLSVLALRGTNNQRNDFLITTTPIADLMQSVSYSPVYFPQFADGGGYTTSLVLLNTANRTEKGTLQILDNNGSPLVVNRVGGTAGSSFRYSIPAGGAFHFQTDGSPAGINVGWARLTPDLYSPTPVGSGVFSYSPGNMLISESGIPSAVSTTNARVYVDLSGDHNTGLAIANVDSAAASVTIHAFQNDGVTPAGTSRGPFQLTAYGHDAEFADQFITGLPSGFTGVLDISSTTPFAALTMRALVNERDDFLMTTFPIADANASAPSPIVFPQFVDGGGYVTEFILISSSGGASTTLSFYDESGTPCDFSN
jgi:hypothetical protein